MNVVKEIEVKMEKVPVPRLTAYISFYPERATGSDPLLFLEAEEPTFRGFVDRFLTCCPRGS